MEGEKRILTRTIDIDVPEGNIVDVISALSAIQSKYLGKDIRVVQKWSGYEDNYFVVEFEEEETDEEFAEREEEERLQRQYEQEEAEEEKRQNNKSIQQQIANLQKKIIK